MVPLYARNVKDFQTLKRMKTAGIIKKMDTVFMQDRERVEKATLI